MPNSPHNESSVPIPTEITARYPRQFTNSAWFAWVICLIGALFYCYEYLLRIMPSIMELELRQAFQLDAAAFGNLMGFYYYAYAPMQLFAGILIDNYETRHLLTFACLICALGSYLFSIESSLFISQIGRLLLGFGSAFAFIGFLKLAALWLPAHRFSLVTGIIMTLCMLGVTQGNVLINAMIQHEGWKQTILIFAGLGVVLAITMAVIFPQKNAYIASDDRFSLKNMKNICKGMLQLAKNPTIWMNGIMGCLLFLSLSAFAESWGISYLAEGRGYPKETAVHLNNYVFWGWGIGSPFVGWLSGVIKKRRLLLLCGALGTAISFASLLYLPLDASLWVVKALLFFIGACSSVEILVFSIARELSPSTLTASTLALTNFLVMMSGAIFQPGIGYLLRLHAGNNIINNVPVYSLNAYRFPLLAMILAALLAAVIAFFMRENPPPLAQRKSSIDHPKLSRCRRSEESA